ncbi:axonemal dynein light intermediate polypeptide 1-like [Conger conger]|uniref:axonemal dynein light intermediate polypeptide 1-like n=1 Tax=Conger conger TaxID=82655 RepID=UPI002A59D718|nr:axonemal dynein light intermediate polypeptide 1-like [Conger conger]
MRTGKIRSREERHPVARGDGIPSWAEDADRRGLIGGYAGQGPPGRGSPQQPPAGSSAPPPPTCPIANAKQEKIEEVLHALLPPREWADGRGLWVQRVSTAPGSRLGVLQLEEDLDLRLRQRQAQETGLCHVQRDLYSQCFDELIRQETINCPDRGLLLQRVRDEISMCIAAYETLDESSVAFGMRKVLCGEQGKAEMEEQISVLEGQNRALQGQLQEMGAECEAVSRRELERRVTEEQKHTDEIELLKRTNQQLKFQLS